MIFTERGCKSRLCSLQYRLSQNFWLGRRSLVRGQKLDLKKSLYYLNINIALMTPVLSVGKGKKLVTDNLESVSLNHTRLHIFVMPFCMSGEV